MSETDKNLLGQVVSKALHNLGHSSLDGLTARLSEMNSHELTSFLEQVNRDYTVGSPENTLVKGQISYIRLLRENLQAGNTPVTSSSRKSKK